MPIPDGCRVHGHRAGYSEELPSALPAPDDWGKDCRGQAAIRRREIEGARHHGAGTLRPGGTPHDRL